MISRFTQKAMTSLKKRSFTTPPRLPRNRSAICELRKAESALETPAIVGSLPRPLVMLHGYADLPERWDLMRDCLERKTRDLPPIYLQFDLLRDVPLAALAAELAEQLETEGLTEVDVLAHSMGGLVGMHLALLAQTAVRVRRIFTLATPFGGTYAGRMGRTVGAPFPTQLSDLSPNSALSQALLGAQRPAGFEAHSYWIQGDLTVPRRSVCRFGAIHRDYPASHWHLPDMTHICMPHEARVVRDVLTDLCV
ncbi:MAG: pimeloyl-ACP methyl ester carboxylesterase [Rhodothermales bacterium]|jgi:pimeloyl-ACP methyl ester carboxylesterase